MVHHKSEFYFISALLVGAVALAIFIFEPFLYALILAAVCATIVWPAYQKILVGIGGRSELAALATVTLVMVVVVLPIAALSVQIAQEATNLYALIAQNDGINTIVQQLLPSLQGFSLDTSGYAQQGLNWIIEHLGSLFKNTARFGINVFIFLVALYYLLKEGAKIKAAIVSVSPLQDVHDNAIFDQLGNATNAVIKGSLAVALIQGALVAVGLALFGVPNATFWGSVSAIAALIPGIGTALVLIPAIVFLVVSGAMESAIGLGAWGIIVVGLADNVVRPKLVGQGTRLHPFLVLLAILGGVSFFGPIGFVLGPLAITLLFALLAIYPVIQQEQDHV